MRMHMRMHMHTHTRRYIKCLVLKLLQSEEHTHVNLFPALATCLQFSESEVEHVATAREAKRSGFLSVFTSGGRRATPARHGRGIDARHSDGDDST